MMKLPFLAALIGGGAQAQEMPEALPSEIGLQAPEFHAVNQRGEPVSRDNLLGKPTVLWFYPMAGTPG